MIVIKSSQIDALSAAARANFDARMAEHLGRLFPRHAAALGSVGFQPVIEDGLRRAQGQGVVSEIGVCRYTELMFYFGADFEQDPLAAWCRPFLAPEGNPAGDHCSALYDEGLRRWEKVAGPDNQFVKDAVGRLQGNPEALLKDSADLPAAFRRIYPEKVEAVGAEAVSQLISLGQAQAKGAGFVSATGVGLYTGLMFALGVGFAGDRALPFAAEVKNTADLDEPARLIRLVQIARSFHRHWS